MRLKRSRVVAVSAILVSSLLASCGDREGPSQESLTEKRSAVVGVDTFLYFRCNATGWGVNQATRLQPAGAAGTFALSYDVTQPWMVAPGGDDCVFTETNQLDGWGTAQTYYSAASVPVRVPRGGAITAGAPNPRNFRVSYPAQGRFRVTVNWNQRTFTIAQVSALFSPIAFFGDTANYQPLTTSRWSVATDAGDNRYFLNTSAFSAASGGRLGEHTLVRDRTYGDFVFRLNVRTNENLGSNPAADFAVVYGFQDASNYSFMSFSARAAETQLFRVTNGQRAAVATASRAGITDAGYHAIQVWRHGIWIRVSTDGEVILSVNDNAGAIVGRAGVGALDDSAFFDDIEVVDYRNVATPHYQVSIPSDMIAYQDSVASLLENAFQLNLDNTGWDINARMGNAFYDYRYRPSGWIWFDDANGCCVLEGGLTVSGGPSLVISELIPESRRPVTEGNAFVAITLHELGNGWFLPGPAPEQWVEWLRSESHSGFLRAAGELDMGYCADANGEHDAHYADYLATSLDDRRLHGAAVEAMLVSLLERYGWGLFRAIYDANLSGQLEYLGGLTSDERDNEMVLFMSRQVNESLIAFFERELGVRTMDYVRTALAGLPVSNLTVLSDLPCHAPTMRATPRVLSLVANAANRRPSAVLYAQAPSAWTARLATTGASLTITRNGTTPMTTITVNADATNLPSGTTLTNQVILEGSGLAGSPLRVPVTVTVE